MSGPFAAHNATRADWALDMSTHASRLPVTCSKENETVMLGVNQSLLLSTNLFDCILATFRCNMLCHLCFVLVQLHAQYSKHNSACTFPWTEQQACSASLHVLDLCLMTHRNCGHFLQTTQLSHLFCQSFLMYHLSACLPVAWQITLTLMPFEYTSAPGTALTSMYTIGTLHSTCNPQNQ